MHRRYFTLLIALVMIVAGGLAAAASGDMGSGMSVPEMRHKKVGTVVVGNLLLVGGGNILLVGGGKLQCVGSC